MQRIFIGASSAILSGLLTPPLVAQTDSLIFNFNGLNRDFGTCEGEQSSLRPRAGLLFKNNRLYGTTPGGGKADGGAILQPDNPAGGPSRRHQAGASRFRRRRRRWSKPLFPLDHRAAWWSVRQQSGALPVEVDRAVENLRP